MKNNDKIPVRVKNYVHRHHHSHRDHDHHDDPWGVVCWCYRALPISHESSLGPHRPPATRQHYTNTYTTTTTTGYITPKNSPSSSAPAFSDSNNVVIDGPIKY